MNARERPPIVELLDTWLRKPQEDVLDGRGVSMTREGIETLMQYIHALERREVVEA